MILYKIYSIVELLLDSKIRIVLNLAILIAHSLINKQILNSNKQIYYEKLLALKD